MNEENKIGCCEECKAKAVKPGIIGTPWCGKFGKCDCHTSSQPSEEKIKREELLKYTGYTNPVKDSIDSILQKYGEWVRQQTLEEALTHFDSFLLDWKDGMIDNSPTAKISWVIKELQALKDKNK